MYSIKTGVGCFVMKRLFANKSNLAVFFSLLASTLIALTYQACSSSEFVPQRETYNSFAGEPLALSKQTFPACTVERSVVITYSKDKGQDHICYDDTNLAAGLNSGAVCPSGPSVVGVYSQSSIGQSCTATTFCGITPTVKELTLGQNTRTRIYELTYTGVPIGCTGNLRVDDQLENTVQLLSFTAPSTKEDLCRRCESGEYACDCYSSSGINGVCGSQNGKSSASKPTTDLCSAGTPGTVVKANGRYEWSCMGSLGGGNDNCYTINTAYVAGVCGRYHGTILMSAPPGDGLCDKGNPTGVSNPNTGGFQWQCQGLDGGPNAYCQAGKVSGTNAEDGKCGDAASLTFSERPPHSYCSMGIPVDITAKSDSYDWRCLGFNSGKAASCSAIRKTN